jgi:predicted TIM-barrel fold metal-dependent hydrolase
MAKSNSSKIDIFTHVLPPKYNEALRKIVPDTLYAGNMVRRFPSLYDFDQRFKVMDKYPGMKEVITLSTPPIEEYLDKKKAADLCKMANDEMAELLVKHPDRFIAAVAALPLNDVDASLKEIDRAINDLKFKGIQMITPINNKCMDSPEFFPIYEKMSLYDLPIWIHPWREPDYPDYRSEKESINHIFWSFGWPYETTTAMARLTFNGVLDKFPGVKFITHHCGAMIPYLQSRITDKTKLPQFKSFYADTALGWKASLTCGLEFFGVDHILFGSDMPYGAEFGNSAVRNCLNAVEEMNITPSDRIKIFEGNARKILRMV